MAVAWLDQYSNRPSKAQTAAELHVAERYWIEDGKCVVADGYSRTARRRAAERHELKTAHRRRHPPPVTR